MWSAQTGELALGRYVDIGSGAEGRVNVFVRDASNAWGRGGVEPDAKGRLELSPLTPGAHTIVIQTKSRHGQGVPLAERNAGLVSGDNKITLSLPALYTLAVELSGSVGTRRIALSRGEYRHSGATEPDENGRVVFDLLPAGEYTIRVYNGEGGSKKVIVPGTTLVRF